MKLDSILLPDDTVCTSGSVGDNAGVLELDAMFQVDAVPGHC
jgi:hypothetical protein